MDEIYKAIADIIWLDTSNGHSTFTSEWTGDAYIYGMSRAELKIDLLNKHVRNVQKARTTLIM